MDGDSTEVRTVSASGGEKGVKLARFDLIPAMPLRRLAELYGRGAAKYAERNWERGYEWSKSYGALQRHLNAFWSGEDWDADTGSHHLDNVAWHAFCLREFFERHPAFDDRPLWTPPEPDLLVFKSSDDAPDVNHSGEWTETFTVTI